MPEPPAGSRVSRLLWNFRHHPKRELWFAWWVMLIFYNLYGLLFFVVTRVQPPPSPAWDTPAVVRWFSDHHHGLLGLLLLRHSRGGRDRSNEKRKCKFLHNQNSPITRQAGRDAA